MLSSASYSQDTACTSRFEITDVLMHGTEGRTGSDASPLHGAARTGKPLRLHGVARMYGCCLTANRTSILQQNLSHRDPNEPGSARPAVRELHSSTGLHGMPDLDHCTELHGTHAAALQASRGCTSLHGSFMHHSRDKTKPQQENPWPTPEQIRRPLQRSSMWEQTQS